MAEFVSYEDFARLEMRMAKIVSVEAIPGKSRIYRGTIDVAGQTRTVIIGGAQYYSPSDLAGRMAVALLNLEPRTISGIKSEGMLLAADVDGKPFWLDASEPVPTGSRIS